MTEKAATDMENQDLRARVVTLEQQAMDRTQRIVSLETWQRSQDIADAKRDEKWVHLDERFNNLDAKINKIGDSLSWINKLVIGGIIAGIVGFMIKGGFNIP